MNRPNRRSPRRQRLAQHLYRCGPRPVLEALLAVEAGQHLDDVLEGFARLPPSVYGAIGADSLDTAPALLSVAGGRS